MSLIVEMVMGETQSHVSRLGRLRKAQGAGRRRAGANGKKHMTHGYKTKTKVLKNRKPGVGVRVRVIEI